MSSKTGGLPKQHRAVELSPGTKAAFMGSGGLAEGRFVT